MISRRAVYIIALACLAACTPSDSTTSIDEARRVQTQAVMTSIIRPAIESYQRHNAGMVPSSLQALSEQETLNEPYLEAAHLVDAWGHPFQYKVTDKREFVLLSYGADGVEGGENENADLASID